MSHAREPRISSDKKAAKKRKRDQKRKEHKAAQEKSRRGYSGGSVPLRPISEEGLRRLEEMMRTIADEPPAKPNRVFGLTVTAPDRPGLLTCLTEALTESHGDIRSLRASSDDSRSVISASISLPSGFDQREFEQRIKAGFGEQAEVAFG